MPRIESSSDILVIISLAFLFSWTIFKIVLHDTKADDQWLFRIFAGIFLLFLGTIFGILIFTNNVGTIVYKPDTTYAFKDSKSIVTFAAMPELATVLTAETQLPDKYTKTKIPQPIPWNKELLAIYPKTILLKLLFIVVCFFSFFFLYLHRFHISFQFTIFNTFAIILFCYVTTAITSPIITLETDRLLLSMLQNDKVNVKNAGDKITASIPIHVGNGIDMEYQITGISGTRLTQLMQWLKTK